MSAPAQPRVGVFGGTFDPVHNGHLHIARTLRQALQLDRLIWVPAGHPPHKTGQIVSNDIDRLTMLELALQNEPGNEISTIELHRTGPSFTADTLEHLRDCMAPAKLVFLMGEDSLRDLPNWRDPDRILQAADVAVAGRPGVDVDLNAIELALPALKGRAHIVPIRELSISSTEIRSLVAAGEPIDGLVPAAVAGYIEAHGLYQTPNPEPR